MDRQDGIGIGPPSKKALVEEATIKNTISRSSGAHIKVTSKGDSTTDDGSLVVSMEINGTMYQGVLFAQTTTSH